MKKSFLFLVISLFLFKGFSQSADRISNLIESTSITKGQASYLAASYLNLIQETDSDAEAFAKLSQQKYFTGKDSDSDIIDYGTLSYIYAKALKIPGGIFYSIFHSKRYAFNELKARGIIPSDCDPSEKVTGRDSIAVFTLCSELKDGSK